MQQQGERAGRCILVAEDEMMVAMLLEDRMESAGYRVLMAAALGQGMELANSQPVDAAILDVNLAGEDSFPLAAALRRRGIPFMFTSGYGSEMLPEAYRDELVLQKPYDMAEVKKALETLLDTVPGESDAPGKA